MAETPTPVQKFAAETLGTFVLVALGCGAAVTTSADIVATGLTFGIAVLVMAYALGRISGGHFNPAVTVGAAVSGRLPWRQVPTYVGAQLLGAVLAAFVLFLLLQGFPGYEAGTAMGQNGFGDQNANDYAWWAAFLLELVLTALFLYVILGVTDERNEHPGLAPLAIGLTLAAIHFVAIPATGTSVNPARSIGPALFAGWDAIAQLWLFILAPLAGAALAGLTYPLLFGRAGEPVPGSGLVFRRGAVAAAPGYGAPDAFQAQWNQDTEATTSIPRDAALDSRDASYGVSHDAGHDGGFDAGHDTGHDAGHDAGFGAGHDAGFGAGHEGSHGDSQDASWGGATAASEGGQPQRIIQDGWEWDYAAQQWKPLEDPPPSDQRG